MTATGRIVSCKIHPAIGIARVGNSTRPDGFFLGPEVPGESLPPPGGYKDPADVSIVLKQACRFWIFGYDERGELVGELPANASVTWRVQLGNKKAEWYEFAGPDGETSPPTTPKRNPLVADRASLVITTTVEEIAGPNGQRPLVGFLGIAGNQPVTLGEMRTENDGKLLVLGGSGEASSWTKPISPIADYVNNNGWHDTTSDGPVTARVVLDGVDLPVTPAWVIVGPPDFAPAIDSIVTLYDVACQVAVERRWNPDPSDPSFPLTFTEHVLPMLRRAMQYQWVNRVALEGHGPDGPGDFEPDLAKLGDPRAEFNVDRQRIFRWVRDPNLEPTSGEAVRQAQRRFMPRLSGDEGDNTPDKFGTWLTVTKAQYAMLLRWSQGDFKPGPAVSLRDLTPDGLDRAALEACTGGAFYPGIEAGWILRRSSQYNEFCRLDHRVPDRYTPGATGLEPGDVTKRSALPWQADFHDCRTAWWPAQRPDEVLTPEAYNELALLDVALAALDPGGAEFAQRIADRDKLWRTREPWAWVPKDDDGPIDHMTMVQNWSRLGFVVGESANGSPFVLQGKPQYVEVGRDPNLART
jgi:hypothetical protein